MDLGLHVLTFHKRKSFTTVQSKLTNLPNELKTEISLKVTTLTQQTGFPPEANVDICFRNLLPGEKTESRASTSAAAELSMRCSYSQLQQIPRENLELQDNAKHNLRVVQKNVRHATQRITTPSFHVKRNSFTTLESKFINLPNELQTEISLKVATLLQRPDRPPKANVDICFRNLVQGFIQLRKEVDRKQTEVKDMREILRLTKRLNELKINDSAEGQASKLSEKMEQQSKAWKKEKENLMNQMQELQKECLDGREKCLNFEQKLALERTEKDHLAAQIGEYKREIAGLQDNYKSDLVLVRTIRTKAAEEGKKWIRGLTILGEELFVVSKVSSEVEVYDLTRFRFRRRWNLKELILPVDIGSCNRNKCLYIYHCKGDNQSKEILRVDPEGKLINKWSTGDDYGWGLSVTDESNVILTVSYKNKLNEYSPEGQLIRDINLSDACIHYPLHALKLTNGHFMVSHGYFEDDLHRVCIVDADGKLNKSFGGKCGSNIGQMNHPFCLTVDGNGYVMVTDQMNSRVLLLDSKLEFKREILSKEKHGLQSLQRIILDHTNGRLLVADNGKDARIMIFQFK